MATPDGKVAFEVGERGYTLQFTTNALCRLEDRLGKSTLDVATELQFNPAMTTIRAMIWAALDDTTLTLGAIGDLIDRIGKAAAIGYAREAYAAAFPEAEEAKDGDERPRDAAAG